MKYQARWITSWHQDCWEKYQQPQIHRWHHPYGRKQRGTKEPLDESETGEWKSWLKIQCSKNKDHGMRSHHFMANRLGKMSKQCQISFSWAPKSMRIVTVALKLKDACSLEEKLWQTETITWECGLENGAWNELQFLLTGQLATLLLRAQPRQLYRAALSLWASPVCPTAVGPSSPIRLAFGVQLTWGVNSNFAFC